MKEKSNVSFSKGVHNSNALIGYVHSDPREPSQTVSKGGARYFLTLIDDYSRGMWVYVLKYKNEALDKFYSWHVLMENHTRKKLKNLRTNNGLELCSKEFNEYCISVGVTRKFIVAGNP